MPAGRWAVERAARSRKGTETRKPQTRRERIRKEKLDITTFFHGKGFTSLEYKEQRPVFSQGDPATAVFYIRSGRIKITVVSRQGKEAVVALLEAGDFFGEGCFVGQPLRMTSATAMTPCTLWRVEKSTLLRLLHRNQEFSDLFVTHLL